MASLVLGAAGAAAANLIFPGGGALLFGMTASQIGFGVGSLAASFLFNSRPSLPPVEGPRIADKAVQTSTYGQVIPKVWGTMRTAGNVIWSTDLIETATTTSQETGGGGKGGGGGGSTQTTTTYTYSASFAVGFCAGPIDGVLRLWADGKLIYDAGTSSGTGAVLASALAVPGMTFYLGNETQTADPTIVSYEGSNTPAYRGLFYVVFDGFQLANYGNRIPNLTAEISANLSRDVTLQYDDTPFDYQPVTAYLTPTNNGATTYYQAWGWTPSKIIGNAEADLIQAPTIVGGQLQFVRQRFFIDGQNRLRHDPITWQPGLATYFNIASVPIYVVGSVSSQNLVQIFMQSGKPLLYVDFDQQYLFAFAVPSGEVYDGVRNVSQYGNDVYFACHTSATLVSIYHLDVTLGASSNPPTLLVQVAKASNSATVLSASANYWYLGVSTGVSTDITKYDRALATIANSWPAVNVGGYQGVGRLEVVDEVLNKLIVINAYQRYVYEVIDGVSTVLNTVALPVVLGSYSGVRPVYTNGAFCLFSDQADGTHPMWYTIGGATGGTLLSVIISDLCEQAGLSSSDYDVSLLSETVNGYIVPNQTSIRAAIQPLQYGFFFDVVESDNKLKFIPRGQSSVITIGDDDVAAIEYSSLNNQQLPDLISPVRKQELEMSKQVIVTYYAKDNDYQQGSQYSNRLITTALNQITQQLPIAFTDAQAAAVADVLLYVDWIQRDQYSLSLSNKYAYLDPCDVLTYISDSQSASYVMRIANEQFNPPAGVVSLSTVPEDSSIYTSSYTGANGQNTSQVFGVSGPTQLQIVDVSCLRDVDNDAGFYAAGCGFLSDWESAQLFKSSDGQATWSAIGYLGSGVLGITTVSLPAGSLDNAWDTKNSVTVKLYPPDGVLSSAASDLAVYNGANTCAIGDGVNWEVLQFATATLNVDGTFTLSRLLRNRKGSDGCRPAGALPVGSYFVLLSSFVAIRVPQSTSEFGIARDFKAVTTGDTLANTSDKVFTISGNSLKPYSPANLGIARNVGLDIIIQWVRRNRLDNEWRDYVDVPQSEATLEFSIDILASPGGAAVRTLTSTSETVTYTAAQQVTDFGSAQASVSIAIYQISAAVGRGFAATLTG